MSAGRFMHPGSRDAPDELVDDGATVSSSARCGLIQCRKSRCQLISHRHFVAAATEHRRLQQVISQSLGTNRLQPQLRVSVLDQSVSRIERQLEHGFPTLPFTHSTRSMFRQLSHHYFEQQVDRLAQLFSPHLDRHKYKSTMIDHAMSNDIFCVCITANAKTDMLMRGHIRDADNDSQIVYATTAHTLRQRLNNFKPTDLDWLLVLVVALVGFDLAFERRAPLKGHHDALRQIIALKGGIHAVGHTRPYVLNTDRFLSAYLGDYPIVRQSPLIPQQPPRPPRSCLYGTAFENLQVKTSIDRPVLEFCQAECQLIDIMEAYDISLLPKTRFASDAAIIPYFLYLRDHLASQGACLYADYHEKRTSEVDEASSKRPKRKATSAPMSKSRCFLLAVLMIDYQMAHLDYYTIKGPFLADQVKKILARKQSSKWKDHVDMLLWLLFVLAIVPVQWTGNQWAMTKLRYWLSVKHGKNWPRTRWINEQLANMRTFVWASALEPRFHQVCSKLSSGVDPRIRPGFSL